MTAASPKTVRADLADALDASRTAREEAERELHRSFALRSRAAEALERTARRPGLDESERARLRAEYADADRVVAERLAAMAKAQEFERAASVVAHAFEDEATSASPLAAALLQLVGSKRGATARRGALVSGRTAPAARVRSPRPRTA
ncbi:hypothetical protein JNB63_18845 [Microbacterium trichothecenolyticum]|uniref:hypothetical protein n=1 Tax=Microbacterium trichothecenolyticum TaxID=69370 RepID=UPI001C6E894E|nr:hypothetical protein [Microbacterium trichothecenolyticum]MBW9122158.1 hypothetical protein [Microbacterium trichothecenolyticum]